MEQRKCFTECTDYGKFPMISCPNKEIETKKGKCVCPNTKDC